VLKRAAVVVSRLPALVFLSPTSVLLDEGIGPVVREAGVLPEHIWRTGWAEDQQLHGRAANNG